MLYMLKQNAGWVGGTVGKKDDKLCSKLIIKGLWNSKELYLSNYLSQPISTVHVRSLSNL